jgi:hypothetical protein
MLQHGSKPVSRGTRALIDRTVEDLEQREAYYQEQSEVQIHECLGRLLSQSEELEKEKERMIEDHTAEIARLKKSHAQDAVRMREEHRIGVNRVQSSNSGRNTYGPLAKTLAGADTYPRRVPDWKKDLMRATWKLASVPMWELRQVEAKTHETETKLGKAEARLRKVEMTVRELKAKLVESEERASQKIRQLSFGMKEARDKACQLLTMLLEAPASNTDYLVLIRLALHNIEEVWTENAEELVERLILWDGAMEMFAEAFVGQLKQKFIDDLGRRFILGLPLIAKAFPDEDEHDECEEKERDQKHVMLEKMKIRMEDPTNWSWLLANLHKLGGANDPETAHRGRRSDWVRSMRVEEEG